MNLQLGVLEEIILLILLTKENTYGVEIAKEYEKQFDQNISLPAIHVVLKRLEKKSLVSSHMGEPTAERGGRRKRIYQATKEGYRVASNLQEKRNNLWKIIPNLNFFAL
ncbi:MAG: PadR family transcriptional regulator [Cyclobacteriaceae bacterium]